MPRILYSLIIVLLQPVVLLRLYFKSRKTPAYRHRIAEHYGFNAPQLDACIWLHAVSVGEAITAKAIIEHLLATQACPVLVTTTTPTGAEQVKRMFGDRVIHRYLPQDIHYCLNRLIKHSQPKLLLVMETELWPNLIALCEKKSLPIMLLNGRLSEKSARSYAKFSRSIAKMLAAINILCIQTEQDAQRFISLGAASERCIVVPSLKFEATITEQQQEQASALLEQHQLLGRFVWIAASTHTGEDEIVLAAHQAVLKQHPEALLILVPRHPERFDAVAGLCEVAGLATERLSQNPSATKAQVLLLDQMGQLLSYYGVADVAFVGGSLNGGGGHNIMEPALWHLPVLSGPGLFNFQAVSDEMQANEGLTIVNDARQLQTQLQRLTDPEQRNLQADKAYAVAQRNKGGLALTIQQIAKLLPS